MRWGPNSGDSASRLWPGSRAARYCHQCGSIFKISVAKLVPEVRYRNRSRRKTGVEKCNITLGFWTIILPENCKICLGVYNSMISR
jgi:hypothetical protein